MPKRSARAQAITCGFGGVVPTHSDPFISKFVRHARALLARPTPGEVEQALDDACRAIDSEEELGGQRAAREAMRRAGKKPRDHTA